MSGSTANQIGKKRLWPFMLFGGVGAGKTTLLRALEGKDPCSAIKSQMIEYAGWGIDTPGEYSEMGHYRRILLTASFDAHLIIVLQDSTKDRSIFPPHYFLVFPQKVLGVVTKMDAEGADPVRARTLLEEVGVTGEIFYVSALTGLGLDTLRDFLQNQNI